MKIKTKNFTKLALFNLKTSIALLIELSLLFVSCRYSLTIEKRHSGSSLVRNYKTSGEREGYLAKRIFRKEHKQMSFKPYIGELRVYHSADSINIEFDSALIVLNDRDTLYSHLFTSRLIQPAFIGCNSRLGHMVEIEELYNLETRHSKRFLLKIWLPYYLNTAEVVLLEVTNSKSKKKIKLSDFVKGAELTFVYRGWIIM